MTVNFGMEGTRKPFLSPTKVNDTARHSSLISFFSLPYDSELYPRNLVMKWRIYCVPWNKCWFIQLTLLEDKLTELVSLLINLFLLRAFFLSFNPFWNDFYIWFRNTSFFQILKYYTWIKIGKYISFWDLSALRRSVYFELNIELD